ncbi:MAG: hypothetical protein ACRDP1_05850 [Nocardioidaceae bacterium]
MKLTRRFARIAVGVSVMAVAVGGSFTAAQAANPADSHGPAITVWPAAVPILGTSLSNSSGSPLFAAKDGWKLYDPDGVCSAYANMYQDGSSTRIWTYSGSPSNKSVTGNYQWSPTAGDYTAFNVYGTDCLGNSNYGYGDVSSTLDQEGAASYSAGWSTSQCRCFSGGAVLHSSKPSATANYTFTGQFVTLVSDKASNRGSASMYIDGVFKKTISFNGACANRVLVWNSPYLRPPATC